MKIPGSSWSQVVVLVAIVATLELQQVEGGWFSLPSMDSVTSWIPGSSYFKSASNMLDRVTGNKPECYAKLNASGVQGCFKKFPVSKALGLPDAVGFHPMAPESINVNYYMYTCNNRYHPYQINWDSTDEYVQKSPYQKDHRTIFIIHGYQDYYEEMGWMGDLKDFIVGVAHQKQGLCKYNVIGVDWRNGSTIPNYPKAAANTMVVGSTVAMFIKQLIRLYGNKPDNFTVVGHSLGGHTSGFVGKQFKDDKLRCIIGLDPAGPSFNDLNVTHRLNPSDAKLVLSIHTNGGMTVGDTFGMLTPSGHYSFFPNGGETQPGCDKTQGIAKVLLEGLVDGLTDVLACSHRRATRIVAFKESLLTYAEGMAYQCKNHEDYKNGKCGECSNPEQCKLFGDWFGWWQEQAPSPNWTKPISYYVDTTGTIPWSMFIFQVIVETGDFAPYNGTLSIVPIGSLRHGPKFVVPTKNASDSNAEHVLKGNQRYTYLMRVPKDLGKVFQARVELNPGVQADNSTKVTIKSVTFNYMSSRDENIRQSLSATLKYDQPFGAGENVLFIGPPVTGREAEII